MLSIKGETSSYLHKVTHNEKYSQYSLIDEWSGCFEAEDHVSAESSDRREGDFIIWLVKACDVDGVRKTVPRQICRKVATVGNILLLILRHDLFQTATISLCRIDI